MERALSRYVRAIIAAITERGTYPTPIAHITSDLAAGVDALAASLIAPLTDAVLAELAEQSGLPTLTINELSQDVIDAINERAFTASQRTINALAGDINASLTASYSAGLGIKDAAQALNDIFDGLKTHELERIARTEINAAQNAAAHQTIREINVQYQQWIATHDDRTRPQHMEMDKQIVRVGDAFSYGMHYPGDFASGVDLGLLINCRCRVRPFIMPKDKAAPALPYFYPDDLITIA